MPYKTNNHTPKVPSLAKKIIKEPIEDLDEKLKISRERSTHLRNVFKKRGE